MVSTVSQFFPGGKYHSKRRQVYAWRKARAVIERHCAQGRRFHRRTRSFGASSTMSKLEEEQLVRWVNELRADGVPVTSLMLKLQEIYQARPRPRVFRASWSWRKLFLRRHRLPIRRKTREGQTTPEDALLKAAEFSEKVRNKMKELGIAVVYNADQTGALNDKYY
ncbi:hypothetical protein PF003_g40932 [Phytophthora fragariae]|nr:hypothetical protein PF003_g40932 [Phytophthora fragariae]